MAPQEIWPIATLAQTNRRIVPFGLIVRNSRRTEFVNSRARNIELAYSFFASSTMIVGLLAIGWASSADDGQRFGAQLIAAVLLMIAPTLLLHSSLVLPRSRILRSIEYSRVQKSGQARLSATELADLTSPNASALSTVLTNRIQKWHDKAEDRPSILFNVWLAAGNGWFVTLAAVAWIGQGIHNLPDDFHLPMRFSVSMLLVFDAVALLLLAAFYIYYANLPDRLKKNATNGHCPACRYDLKATDIAEQVRVLRCPECGLAMPFIPMMPAKEWRELLDNVANSQDVNQRTTDGRSS